MPPFKSKAQVRYLYAKEPEVAKEFAGKTKSIKKLPEKVGVKTSPTRPVMPRKPGRPARPGRPAKR